MAGKKALEQHLERSRLFGKVNIERPTNYRVQYHLNNEMIRQSDDADRSGQGRGCASPTISIVIPFKDKVPLLKACVDSILEQTTYDRYEVILVSNNSEETETYRYVENLLRSHEQFSSLEINEPFNFSRLNNRAVEDAKGDYLLFLNNDTEIRTATWLETLVGYAQLPLAGAVGAKMVFPDGRIQHTGITLGVMGAAWNSFWNAEREHLGYFHNLVLARNCSAVSAACLLVSREKFFKVEGFNEELAVGFNDVDLCLKLMDSGLYNIFVPFVELMHDESASRGTDNQNPERLERNRGENAYLQKVWSQYVDNDPFYNPNLSRDTPYFEIGL